MCPRACSACIMATELSLYALSSGKGSIMNNTCISAPDTYAAPRARAGRID
ncbi:Uncharacterised protein [Bordetella pertussis]|nr:Uncharacterised protein [Bordetella pertussis]CFP60569.1 Uncharacterised protein [Bordetella pertussis]